MNRIKLLIGIVVTAIFLSTMMLTSCGTTKHIATNQRDSVVVEVKEKIVTIRDTVEVEVPKIVEKKVVDQDSSYLVNKYAESEAIIQDDGKLYHSLSTIPQKIEKPAEVEVVVRDTIIYKERIRENIIKVERDLTWWQETQIGGFWVLLLISCGFVLVKRFFR